MTGPKKSVIGMEVASSIKRFVTSLPERYTVAQDSEIVLQGCILEIDDSNGQATKIERIRH